MKRLNQWLVFLSMAVVLNSDHSTAATLGTYTFTGADPGGDASVPTASGLTFGAFSRFNVNASSTADVFNSSGWPTTGPLSTQDYVQFVLTPDPGNALELDFVSFQAGRSSLGPTNAAVAIFVGIPSTDADPLTGHAMDSFVVTISPSLTNMTFDFSDVSMSADQQAALRFYGFEAGDNAGTFRLDNVLIDGAVIPAPVPETSTAATIIFSACFVVWRVARCGYARRKERLASSTANSSNSSQGPCR